MLSFVDPRRATLNDMLGRIEQAVRQTSRPVPRVIAAALAPSLSDPDLLHGIGCAGAAECYTRHLLHAGDGYCVLALTWRPGQMSPVHAHKTWCALGVHRGWLVESFFRPDGDSAVPTRCVERAVGNISHAAADLTAIHRLANVGTAEAVSIHVYGASYDRLGEDVNHVVAA